MPDSLARLGLALGLLLPVLAQQTVVLPSTDPDITYNPPLCTATSAAGCTSPWQVSNDSTLGTNLVYTDGPIPQAGNVIPQLFLNFRASTLYLSTTSFSNATINFTLTAEPTDVSITREVNTSISLIVAVDIPETQVTTLGVTFLPQDVPTRFDVTSIALTVANASSTSSFLPLASLPSSSSPPIYVPTPTVSPTVNSSACKQGTIIGASLGGVLGALSLVIAFLLVYRYRKRRTTISRQSPRLPWRRH